ncbi:MAG: type I methionyl aminopeptidase [Eubacteriales bacterium]|jgi:methionyl aminopeptidase
MIKIKNNQEIALMREAGKITAGALALAATLVKPGVSLIHIDSEIHRFITSHGAIPSFLHYNGFPASACISVNDEVIHGIPGKRLLTEGDIVKVDVGACYKGYHGDAARTLFCGEVSEDAKRLERITRESFFEGIKYADPSHRLGDISHAIQEHVESAGFSVVKDFVGHGVGAHLHEDPEIPNYGKAGRGTRLYEGMTLAIEPMVNFGTAEVSVLDNDWTVVTDDGALSAHYENSILITENGPEILTKL